MATSRGVGSPHHGPGGRDGTPRSIKSERGAAHARPSAAAILATFAVVAFAVVALGSPADAKLTPGPPPGAPKAGTSSELVMSGTGPGGGVDVFIGPSVSSSDPAVPYPSSPPPGFTSH